ncbi:hypothetical protein [Buttiauxella agrestis]|uniref:hypothetical protein n=1 Tax=Buttiauxella agrestis TaxID=82977 RepID=UPI00397661F6
MNDEQIIATANRAQLNEDNKINACGRTLHIGFFFDGVGRNIENDAQEHRLSNICRLYRAFPEEEMNTKTSSHSKFYFSGMGTPFKEELSTKLHAVMDTSQSKALDEAVSIPKDAAQDAAKDIFTGDWYEVLDKQWKKLWNPAEWRKTLLSSGSKIVARASIEAMPWLRDNKYISEILVTGVDTRVNTAKFDFEKSYHESIELSPLPIKRIAISIFGFDLGATLARKFIDDLLKDIFKKETSEDKSVEKYTYENVPVDIIFTGLFDCSRQTPASSNNGLDYFVAFLSAVGKTVSSVMGEKAIDQDTPLPKAVRKALHLVAAHERRPWRSLYSLGKEGSWEEILLPGSSEDIGGGLLPDEQKPSAELCRVALHQMYRTAYMAGVPFPDYQTLDQTDTDIANYFLMNDAIEGRSSQYWAKRYQAAIGNNVLSNYSQNLHLDAYFNWLGQQYYLYCMELGRLDAEKAGTMATIVLSTEDPEEQKKITDNHLARETLKKNWGWLDDVKDQALLMKNSITTDSYDRRVLIAPKIYIPAFKRAERFLEYSHCAYQNKPMPPSADHAPGEIFSWLIHDIQKVDPDASITQDFLVIRSVENPKD